MLLCLLRSSIGRVFLTLVVSSLLSSVLLFSIKCNKKRQIIRSILAFIMIILAGEVLGYSIYNIFGELTSEGDVALKIIGVLLNGAQIFVAVLVYKTLGKLQEVKIADRLAAMYTITPRTFSSYIFGCATFVMVMVLAFPVMKTYELRYAVDMVLLTPIIEEFVFRFSIPLLLKLERVNFGQNILFSGVFAAFHEPSSIPIVFITSLILYGVVNKTKSIIPAMIIHGSINLVVLILE